MPGHALALMALLAVHSRSEGRSAFRVADDGRVDIDIELIEQDLPELCDVDLSVVDPARRAAYEERLGRCVEEELPRWLRLRVDDDVCRVRGGSWRRGAGMLVVLSTRASCPPPAGRTLTIDWGLFLASSLDHTSTATVTLPDGTPRRALLSRRHNKLVVEIPGRSPIVIVTGLIAVVAAVTVLALRRRARSRRQG